MNLNKARNLLLFSLAAETFFASYGLLLGSQTAMVSVMYLITGLLFIFSLLSLPQVRFPSVSQMKKEIYWKLPVLLVMIGIAFITARFWLFQIPLDPDYADMLPVIKVMNERFIHGNWKHVYDSIPEIWKGTQPIYLPAMWLPYAGAIWLHLDLRWVTVVSVLVSFGVILFLVRLKQNRYFGYSLLIIGSMLFWWIYARNDVHFLISLSEEGVVIFYFILLTLAIISSNPYIMGIAASLCILSRYSMIGWLLPCLLLFYYRKEYQKIFIFTLCGVVCFLLLFLFPFGMKTFQQMIALPGNYVAFAKRIWENSPEVYWLNLGLAKFFGAHRMKLLHQTLLTSVFLVPVVFMCFCLFQKKWEMQNVNLACFKLSLVVFYQFIDVPYGYLFYTSSFVSLLIAVLCLDPWTPIPIIKTKNVI